MKKLLMLGLIPVLSSACSPENNTTRSEIIVEQSEQTGRIAIPLTSIASFGAVYQLLLPLVYFAGPSDEMEVSFEDESELAISLEEGGWTIEIGDNLQVRKSFNDTDELIQAEITSDNPQEFSIVGGETTTVTIGVRTLPSEDRDEEPEEIEFEYGDLEIEVEIDDQATEGDDTEDTADEFDDTGDYFAPSQCQAGPPYTGPLPYNTKYPREVIAMNQHIAYCYQKNCTAKRSKYMWRIIVECI
jgi:hypothetical protein